MSGTDFNGRDSPTRIRPKRAFLTSKRNAVALGDETLFRVLYTSKHVGKPDSKAPNNTLTLDADRVESSLAELVDIDPVECRMRSAPEMDDGEIYARTLFSGTVVPRLASYDSPAFPPGTFERSP